MAFGGLLALLDDVAATLDDVAALSKVAAEKTAGLAGDDLAVNAHGLVGIQPARELPIVGKVALGSVLNKFVLVPLALLVPPGWITPILMSGGAFLCYEGVHKVMHSLGWGHHEEDHAQEGPPPTPEALEREKVRSAIITDVVLSAEIVAVTLGSVIEEPLAMRAGVLSLVALGMTFGIYGAVALIVKLDDIGLSLQQREGLSAGIGGALVRGTPAFMKLLSIGGTVAMFLVGGGILLHGLHPVEEAVHHAVAAVAHGGALEWGLSTLATGLVGLVLGALVVAVVDGGKALITRG